MQSSNHRPEALGERVRRLRLASGLTQDEFVRRSGLSKSHIVQVEKGTIGQLRSDTLQSYAEVLGVSPDYLLTGEEPAPADGLPDLEAYFRMRGVLSEDQIRQIVGVIREQEELQLEVRALRQAAEQAERDAD
jgi:transcriptional regulator with XRE-family HTH domain